MRKSTMIELVVELEKLSPNPMRDQMIEAAKRGDFHDFKSPAICGKLYFLYCSKWFQENIKKLATSHASYSNIDTEGDIKKMQKMEEDIKDGEYDESPDEEDRANILRDIDLYTDNPEQIETLINKMIGLLKN